ncbi:hypothetical protein B7463_g7849, partial [Scytalidium lignicola]
MTGAGVGSWSIEELREELPELLKGMKKLPPQKLNMLPLNQAEVTDVMAARERFPHEDGISGTTRIGGSVFTENEMVRYSIVTEPEFGLELGFDWQEPVMGEEITVFDPMEPAEALELAPEATESIEEDVPERKIAPEPPEPTFDSGEPEELSEPNSEPESDAESELIGSTIMVDTGNGEYANWAYYYSTTPIAEKAFRAQESHQFYIPKTEEEALADPLWREAIQKELDMLQALGTWGYADLPKGCNLVGSKWVFTIKFTPTGQIERRKGRSVAQGYSQSLGDDYLEIFSPTIRPESLKTPLAIGAKEDLEMRKIDVVSAYPRAKLHATIYMRAPIRLKVPGGKVLLLRKPLYGLTHSEGVVYRGLYVDDMVVMGKDLQAVQKTINGIAAKWDIKDMGPAHIRPPDYQRQT